MSQAARDLAFENALRKIGMRCPDLLAERFPRMKSLIPSRRPERLRIESQNSGWVLSYEVAWIASRNG